MNTKKTSKEKSWKRSLSLREQIGISIFLFLAMVLFWTKVIGKVGQLFDSLTGWLSLDFWLWILGAIILVIVVALARWALKGRNIPFKPGKWLGWAIVIVVIVFAYREYGEWTKNYVRPTPTKSYTQPIPSRLPAEIVLPIIAQCESGGRQFEADGVTPRWNRRGSSALGKWQIIASTHKDECPNLDIRTEAGNEACAIRLYDRFGTKPWEADPDSENCWRPRLLALGSGVTLPTADTTFVDTAKPGEPVAGVMPVGWRLDAWVDLEKVDQHVLWRGRNKIRVFTTKPSVEEAEVKIRVYPCSVESPC